MADENLDTPTDESTNSSTGGDASTASADSSSAVSTSTSDTGVAAGSDNTQTLETGEQVVVDPIEAALKDLPTADELRLEAERGVKYARALQDLRPIAEQARTQSQTFKSWQPIVDQYSDPARLTSQLELASQFLKDQEVEGRTVPDTKGAVEWLDANSPTRADSLMVDLLQSKATYNGVEDTRLNHTCLHLFGRNYEGVVQGLKDLETRPASSQVVDQVELDSVPAQYHGIWKGLAPELKEVLMDDRTSEVAKTQILQNALTLQQRDETERTAAERTNAERVERETAFFNEAKAEGAKAVDAGLGTILNSILDSTFKDISNETVTMTGSKEGDVLQRLFIGGTLTSLTDPFKRPYIENELKTLGITLDPEIDQYAQKFERATAAAVIAQKYGDKASAEARKIDADNAAMWIKAKGNDLAAQMITRLSAVLGISNANGARLLASANGGRPAINGNPLASAGGGNGQPKFTTSATDPAARTAEIVSRFARQ